jgi:hypothetical protein
MFILYRGAGGVTPKVARRLSDQDRMQHYRMPVRCMDRRVELPYTTDSVRLK